MFLGSTATLQNSQCSLSGSGTSVTGSGTYLTLKIPITFKPAFAGLRNVYMSASDKSGVTSSDIQTRPLDRAIKQCRREPAIGRLRPRG